MCPLLQKNYGVTLSVLFSYEKKQTVSNNEWIQNMFHIPY